MLKRFIKNKNGFSLLEMLVAVTVFSIVAIAATSIFQMAVEGQRNAIAAQNTQESMRYALEVMSKELRMAQRDTGNTCTTNNAIFEVAADVLYFRNKDNNCVIYSLNSSNNRLEISRMDSVTSEIIVDDYITPDEIKISNLKFSVDNNYHAKVTMSMDVEAIGKAVNRQPFKIQMTVSSRYYE